MSRLVSALDRLIIAVVSLAFGAVAVALVAWALGVEPVAGWVRELPRDQARSFPDATWWVPLLVGVVVIGIIGGVWLLLINLRRPRLGQVDLPGSSTAGLLRGSTRAITEAAAADLQCLDGIRRVDVRCGYDRGRKTADFAVTVEPLVDLEAVHAACMSTAQDVTGALASGEIACRFLIKLDPVQRTA